MLYDKFVNRYTVTGKLIAIDPIHIGSSSKNSLDPIDVNNSVLKDNLGRPIIPGSSLKGVIRSYFESVLRAIDERKACMVLENNRRCCTEKNKEKFENIEDPLEKAKAAYENSCDVCRLFGGREFAGKLQFKDCYLIGKPSFEQRDGVAIDRETGAASAKYDFEIISKDTEFEFFLTADNLDEQQEKYLDFILNAMQEGNLALGGNTTRGLGRFKLVYMQINKITADDIKNKLGL